jgi:hypothetical protein
MNLALCNVIVEMTDHNRDLMNTLCTRVNEDGWVAMQYLREWWANGTNEGGTSAAKLIDI